MAIEIIAGSDFEKAIRAFRRQVQRDGTVQRFRDRVHGFYNKPSSARKFKARKAELKRKKRERSQDREWTSF